MALNSPPRKSSTGRRTVAVDVGFSNVRVVEVDGAGADVRLLKRGSAPVTPGWWETIGLSKLPLAHAIKDALASAGISASEVVATMPRRLVTLKYARLPHAEPDQIEGMVQFEAQQYIPFQLEDVVLDHQIVSDSTDEMTTAMIVAAKRDLVEGLMLAFDSAGLEVSRLTVSSLGLAEHARGSVAPVALLDVEPGEMDMAIVADGKLLFSRSASLSTTEDDSVDSKVLAGEVARSFAAYQNEYRGQAVTSLQVGGSAAKTPGIHESLDDLLDVPVSRMNGNLMPAGDPETLSYTTAIGVALGADGRGLSDINLIPKSRAEKKVAAQRKVQALAAGILLIALAAGGIAILSSRMAAQKVERAQALRENRKLSAIKSAATKTKSEHDTVTKTYQIVANSLGRDKPAVDVIKAVSDAIPKGTSIYLTQLSFERSGAVSIHGNTKSETAATDFTIALQASGVFTDVRLPYMGDAQAESTVGGAAPAGITKPKPGENMSFIIACKVKGMSKQELDKLTSGKPSKAAPAGGTDQ